MKACIKCNQEKAKTEFHKDARRPDGLFPYCKDCRRTTDKPKNWQSIEYILSNYEIKESGCWHWTGTKMLYEDYGIAHYKGGRVRAHRLSYMHHVGDIPEGLLICHTCDNPICINPDHLYAGTPEQNMRDMHKRNRNVNPKGEERSNSKLISSQIIEIRADRRLHKVIAKDYGIAASTVSAIKCRRTWNHLV